MKHSKDKEFSFKIKFGILTDPDISPTELRLFLIIQKLSLFKGYCFASNDRLAEYAGLSKRSTKRRIYSLRDKGYIGMDYSSDERRIYPNSEHLPTKLNDMNFREEFEENERIETNETNETDSPESKGDKNGPLSEEGGTKTTRWGGQIWPGGGDKNGPHNTLKNNTLKNNTLKEKVNQKEKSEEKPETDSGTEQKNLLFDPEEKEKSCAKKEKEESGWEAEVKKRIGPTQYRLLKKHGKELNFNPDQLEPFLEWLEYKKESGKIYRSRIGLTKIRNKFADLPGNVIQESVDNCIANNYIGLFIKNENNGKRKDGTSEKEMYGNATKETVGKLVRYFASGGK